MLVSPSFENSMEVKPPNLLCSKKKSHYCCLSFVWQRQCFDLNNIGPKVKHDGIQLSGELLIYSICMVASKRFSASFKVALMVLIDLLGVIRCAKVIWYNKAKENSKRSSIQQGFFGYHKLDNDLSFHFFYRSSNAFPSLQFIFAHWFPRRAR